MINFCKDFIFSVFGSLKMLIVFIVLSFLGYILGYLGLIFVYNKEFGMPPLLIEYRSQEQGIVGLYRNKEKHIELFVWTLRFHKRGFIDGIFFTIAHEYRHHMQYQDSGRPNEDEANRWAESNALCLFKQ